MQKLKSTKMTKNYKGCQNRKIDKKMAKIDRIDENVKIDKKWQCAKNGKNGQNWGKFSKLT